MAQAECYEPEMKRNLLNTASDKESVHKSQLVSSAGGGIGLC